MSLPVNSAVSAADLKCFILEDDVNLREDLRVIYRALHILTRTFFREFNEFHNNIQNITKCESNLSSVLQEISNVTLDELQQDYNVLLFFSLSLFIIKKSFHGDIDYAVKVLHQFTQRVTSSYRLKSICLRVPMILNHTNFDKEELFKTIKFQLPNILMIITREVLKNKDTEKLQPPPIDSAKVFNYFGSENTALKKIASEAPKKFISASEKGEDNSDKMANAAAPYQGNSSKVASKVSGILSPRFLNVWNSASNKEIDSSSGEYKEDAMQVFSSEESEFVSQTISQCSKKPRLKLHDHSPPTQVKISSIKESKVETDYSSPTTSRGTKTLRLYEHSIPGCSANVFSELPKEKNFATSQNSSLDRPNIFSQLHSCMQSNKVQSSSMIENKDSSVIANGEDNSEKKTNAAAPYQILHSETYLNGTILDYVQFWTNYSQEHTYSLKDYIRRKKNNQTAIYYLASESREKAMGSIFIEKILQLQIEVIIITDSFEEFLLKNIKQYKGMTIISAKDINVKYPEDTKVLEKYVKYKQQYKSLCEEINHILELKLNMVIISQRLVFAPACIISEDKEEMGDKTIRNAKANAIMEINPDNNLIQNIHCIYNSDKKNLMFQKAVHFLFNAVQVLSGCKLEDEDKSIWTSLDCLTTALQQLTTKKSLDL